MWPWSTIKQLRFELASSKDAQARAERARDTAVDQARMTNASNRALTTQRDEALRLASEARDECGVLEARIAELRAALDEARRDLDQNTVAMFDLQNQLEAASKNDFRDPATGRFAKKESAGG